MSQLNQQLKQIQQIQGNIRMNGAQIPNQSLVQAIQALDASQSPEKAQNSVQFDQLRLL